MKTESINKKTYNYGYFKINTTDNSIVYYPVPMEFELKTTITWETPIKIR